MAKSKRKAYDKLDKRIRDYNMTIKTTKQPRAYTKPGSMKRGK